MSATLADELNHFFAVQHPLVSVENRGGLHPRCIGTGCFFGHGITDAFFAVEQRFQEFFFLKICSVFQQGQHGGIVRALSIER